MPAISLTSLPNTLATRASAASNVTSHQALQVVCAWPVSGQYGAGTRVLYYILIAACVLARKTEWLRNAYLAAALLFPAVAAVHGIVLAATHVDGAVDMDVYGAFQLCSIGILAAPVTVRLSRTYFYDPGRNTIFLWTGLILAGLLSLTVEFFRVKPSDCTHDDSGRPISSNPREFPYETSCGLVCSVEKGPFSPLRSGAANDIYVIPAPDQLTFGTATLLAAACCIPAILSLVFTWIKILDLKWKTPFSEEAGDEQRIDEPIEGTNGATVGKMQRVNALVRLFLSVVEIPVFGAAVLAILIMGERNFFSSQVGYQTEPIAAIGQWAPIVGTVLAALGSLYLLLTTDLGADKNEASPNIPMHQCNCSMREVGIGVFTGSSHSINTPSSAEIPGSPLNGDRETSRERVSMTSTFTPVRSYQTKRSLTVDTGNRRKVARTLTAMGNYLSDAVHDRLDDSGFKHGKALDFPEIPGEEHRNSALRQIREQYNSGREAEGIVTPVIREPRSRAGSFISTAPSRSSVDGGSTPRATLPQRVRSPRSRSPLPSPTTSRKSHDGEITDRRSSFDHRNSLSSRGSNGVRPQTQRRRDTLEVPSPAHHSPGQNSAFSIPSIVTPHGRQNSPAIIVSSNLDTTSSGQNPPAPDSPSEPQPMPPPAVLRALT